MTGPDAAPLPSWLLDIRGLKLRLWELGDPDAAGPPIVCLHGWLDQGMAFVRTAQAAHAMGPKRRWLAIDQRGFGGSDHIPPGAYPHFADYVSDLDALVEHLGQPIDLVGHSMGGTVAAYYAGARPEMIRNLAIIEGMGTIEPGGPPMLEQVRKHLQGLRCPPRVPWHNNIGAAAARLRSRHPGLTADHAQALAEAGTTQDGDKVRWSFDPLHLTRGAYPFIESFFLDFLRAITAPTLVTWAEGSWYPEEVRTHRQAAIPGARIETLKGGHMLPYDNPAGLAGLLVDHFS